MKILKTLALTLLIGFSQTISAQTADEIIDNYWETVGGKENWAKVEGTLTKAKTMGQGMEIPLEIISMKDGKTMVTFTFQGKEVKSQVFDGEVLWGHNMMTMEAEKQNEEQTKIMKDETLDFPNAFIDYKSKGYKVELIGKETVEGTSCFKIKITKKPVIIDGKEVENASFYYFDDENFVPIVVEKEILTGQMKGQSFQTVLSDYQEVEGLYFPYSSTQKLKGTPQGQTITIESIELNPKVEASLFAFPKKEAASTGTAKP
ncbi:MAG: outer membrane lipoprotein-sorting protein [Bacteroidota bacterium]